ncbi:RagB/SusD family nutrient uptake outer membrane protein [Polaribacter sp. Hel1_85]|uniref:RagB/SusD family nutrient uptake outer membrane protein n=1 Tax=Polaribacter sp. Hel1_85 TaxID=1250005 RepID=UPI00052B8595|nr:RagB/SusD family nutrient uptake outer membrane protein [Polaribacter sp. Hel1_85]KGL59016.1 SusD/RagB family lipoprotein [Polaribacter sp. Hel1_85]
MKKIFYITLIIISLGVISCESNLDLTPTYSLNEKNAIENEIDARAAVNGVYETIVNSDNFSGKLFVSLASKAGFVKWSSADYKMEYSQSNETTSNIPNRWLAYYETLNTANFAISNIHKLTSEQIDLDEKNMLEAEARCLRAFANIFVFWNYGHWWSSDDNNPNGIIFRDKAITIDDIEIGRLNVGESYEKIYEDLDFAIEYLGSFTDNRYVSKEFAKVLKAKIILYRNGYNDGTANLNEALNLINEVLKTSIPGFSMQGDLAKVYEDSWDSEENLFCSYVSDNGDRIYNISYTYSFTMVMTYGNRLPLAWYASRDAGLNFGLAWFEGDPRWDIVTGEARAPIAWDTDSRFTFTKVARLGQYAGQNASPQDLKYNTYFFRYPELYILKAELLARTGASISDAIAPINEMRSKRTNPVLNSINPTTQEGLMDAIFKEYFFETFVENGSEYFASLRFKDSSGKLWMESIKGEPIDENHLCYPIPNVEMQYNKLIEQNTDLQ